MLNRNLTALDNVSEGNSAQDPATKEITIVSTISKKPAIVDQYLLYNVISKSLTL